MAFKDQLAALESGVRGLLRQCPDLPVDSAREVLSRISDEMAAAVNPEKRPQPDRGEQPANPNRVSAASAIAPSEEEHAHRRKSK
jgi:hypothetical protein